MTELVRIAVMGLLAAGALAGKPSGGTSDGGQTVNRVEARLVLTLPRESDADSLFLERPVGATRFSNGVIAVADGMAPAVRFFDAEGAFFASAGRAGEGPNEFSTPGWLGRCGEAEARVWDFSLMRFTSLDGSGRITSQTRLLDEFNLPRPPSLLSCSRTGHLALLLRLGGERIPGREISLLTSSLHLVPPGGEPLVLLDTVPVIEWINEERTYRASSMTTHFALSDSLAFVARSDSAVVHVFGLDGEYRRSWMPELSRREPTEEHIRRSAETLTAFIPNHDDRAEIIARYLEMPRRPFLPYHNGLRTDPQGRIWIILSFPGDQSTSLRAYEPTGELVGEVHVPVGLEVLEVGDGHVLGWFEDRETFEPRIALYEFDLG